MITERDLTCAIGAHSLWKSRLKNAIQSGTIDVPLTTIEADDACPFGKWLESIAAEAKAGFAAEYALTKRRHAHFHKIAARVVLLALHGRTSEAEEMLSFQGELSVASAMLTEAMIEWKAAIGELAVR